MVGQNSPYHVKCPESGPDPSDLSFFFQKCSDEDSEVKRYALHTMQLTSVDYNVQDQSGGSTLSLSLIRRAATWLLHILEQLKRERLFSCGFYQNGSCGLFLQVIELQILDFYTTVVYILVYFHQQHYDHFLCIFLIDIFIIDEQYSVTCTKGHFCHPRKAKYENMTAFALPVHLGSSSRLMVVFKGITKAAKYQTEQKGGKKR